MDFRLSSNNCPQPNVSESCLSLFTRLWLVKLHPNLPRWPTLYLVQLYSLHSWSWCLWNDRLRAWRLMWHKKPTGVLAWSTISATGFIRGEMNWYFYIVQGFEFVIFFYIQLQRSPFFCERTEFNREQVRDFLYAGTNRCHLNFPFIQINDIRLILVIYIVEKYRDLSWHPSGIFNSHFLKITFKTLLSLRYPIKRLYVKT